MYTYHHTWKLLMMWHSIVVLTNLQHFKRCSQTSTQNKRASKFMFRHLQPISQNAIQCKFTFECIYNHKLLRICIRHISHPSLTMYVRKIWKILTRVLDVWKTFDVLLRPFLLASIYTMVCMCVHALQEGIETCVCMNKLLQQTDKLYITENNMKMILRYKQQTYNK